jgi:hypothetical protein
MKINTDRSPDKFVKRLVLPDITGTLISHQRRQTLRTITHHHARGKTCHTLQQIPQHREFHLKASCVAFVSATPHETGFEQTTSLDVNTKTNNIGTL